MKEHIHTSVGAFGYLDNKKECPECKQMENIEFNQTKYIFDLLQKIEEFEEMFF